MAEYCQRCGQAWPTLANVWPEAALGFPSNFRLGFGGVSSDLAWFVGGTSRRPPVGCVVGASVAPFHEAGGAKRVKYSRQRSTMLGVPVKLDDAENLEEVMAYRSAHGEKDVGDAGACTSAALARPPRGWHWRGGITPPPSGGIARCATCGATQAVRCISPSLPWHAWRAVCRY